MMKLAFERYVSFEYNEYILIILIIDIKLKAIEQIENYFYADYFT